MSDLRGNEEDVPFDWGGADRLIAAATSAASTVEWSAVGWGSRARTASVEFRGLFSRLFDDNAVTAAADAREIATALRDLATVTGRLKGLAEEEQQRREEARRWYAEQQDRNAVERGLDWLGDKLTGDDTPEVRVAAGPPPPISVQHPSTGFRETPTGGGGGGGGGGTSSARPQDLFTFADGADAATDDLTTTSQSVSSAHSSFSANTQWGRVEADGLFSGFTAFLELNRADARWSRVVARAFEAAGSRGSVSTLADSAVASALAAAGVSASRVDLQIDPPVAYGEQPTTGYADDPVNTATGNFTHTEVDLGFVGGAATLGLRRTYNALAHRAGDSRAVQPYGPGWSTWTDARLDLDAHGDGTTAAMTLPEGRQIQFARETTDDGDVGWGRAIGDNYWLEALGRTSTAGHAVTDNRGGRWTFDGRGRLVEVARGAGTGVRLTWDDAGGTDRVTRLEHERGRWIELAWEADGAPGGRDRLTGATSSDGREVSYAYDEHGRLVAMTSEGRTRSYTWDDLDGEHQGLLIAVTDPDGVAELDNTYDDRGRVRTQRSPHGRLSRYAYLDGRITVVSDADGTRSNTWVADHRGRLVAAIDAHDERTSFAYDRHGNQVLATERDGSTTTSKHDDRGRLVRQITASGADLSWGYDEHDRVTTVVAESGAVTTMAYDPDPAARNPIRITDPEGGVTELHWTDGLLDQVVDPTGVLVEFTYDAHGDLVATTDAHGGSARLERDALGRVVAAVRPSGARTTFTYDGAGALAARTDPDGATWRFEHSDGGRLTATIDPTGARTTLERDGAGETVRTVDPLGRAVHRTLDDLGLVSSVELPDGARWSYAHDALSRLVAVTDPTGGTWRTEHDAMGRPAATVDPTGAGRRMTIDRRAGEVSVTSPTGDVLTSRSDALGRALGAVGPDGSGSVLTHDRCGRVVEVVDPEGGLTRIVRDASGRPVEVSSPGGAVTRYSYDACGRLATTTDPTGATTTRGYDVDGRLVTLTGPAGEIADMTYDACGRLVRRRVPGRGTQTWRYDAAGRVTATRDPWHGRRAFAYDAAGQLVAVTNALGGVTRWEYDANGRAVRIIDPLGHVTSREFDGLNRCIAETDPLGRTTRAGYDAVGRQAWQTDAGGSTTTWARDEAGRLTEVAVDGRTASRWAYDARSRTTTVLDHHALGGRLAEEAQRRHELAYDRRGHLVRRARVALVDAPGEATGEISWTYDADGHRRSVTVPAAQDGADGAVTTTYDRDAAGRVVGVGHPLLGRATISRDVAGRPVEVRADGDGRPLRQTFTYADGWLTATEVQAGEASSSVRVARDDQGRLTRVTRDGRTTTYAHDSASQLLGTVSDDGTTRRWRYDAAGRLVGERVVRAETVSEISYRYDEAGQLLTSTAQAPGGEQRTEHAYDAAGRRIATSTDQQTVRYTWSPTGWLATTETETSAEELLVDALGELARVSTAQIWWDTAAGGLDPLLVGSDPVVGAGPLTGVGDQWRTPGWRTARETDPADPWSVETITGGPEGLGVSATGVLHLAGLEWMGARAYDPATRGFLTVDPLDPTPGAPWAGNPYSYAGNDPLHATDPTGLSPLTDADLQSYLADRQGAFHAAGEWAKNNWEYVAGGAMVIAGGALMFTGVGGPAGAMLMAAGADTIIQKATTGDVNWGQVAISGAFGAWGGVGAAARMGVQSALGRAVVGGAISGGTSGAVSGAYGYATGPGPHTAGGLLRATATNSLVGAGSGSALGGVGHQLSGGASTASSAGRTLDEVAPQPRLPDLEGTIRDSFRGGSYEVRHFPAGTEFYRAEGWADSKPGSFLGLESADNHIEAEQAYNIAMWDNPIEVQRRYVLTEGQDMYYGSVAGGEGYQALIPRDVDPSSILQQTGAKPLR
ncbi:hypothetical protein KLP28_13745 [Nocardioidaceae bacterium]|nr:hypothetical protein KLP28_13745 [Nocardioidaceae bacterium]